ncbi:putative laminin [Fasciola gigantica]|uniref:Putative laminin n=1 Tax=Fasciola gigantica TaxID=46835 RepID=A0A504YJT9_FASGI|nr:putative laminin [Fasciola gigantica]
MCKSILLFALHSNDQGPRCDQCKPGTFGLNNDYPLGCYSCFCFPTNVPPKCSLLTGYRSVPGKERGVDIIASDLENVPGGSLIQLSVGLGPEATTDLSVGVSQFDWRFSAHRPTFMEIPELKGSLMRNYGSVVIAVSTECLRTGDCRLNAPDSRYPLELMTTGPTVNRDEAGAYIEGTQTTIVDGFRHIWLRESDWVLTKVVDHDTRVRPSRNELMLALLNVTSFSVRLFMPEANPKMVSYAITCIPTPDRPYISHRCICKPGYGGARCEVCSPGYFGDPMSMIACQPCDCDMAGSLSPNCAQDTGQCRCAPGVHGRRCDQCEPDHVVDAGRCIDCRGPCTGELFTKADQVMTEIDNLNVTSLAYRGLARLGQQVEVMRKRFSPAREQDEKNLITRTQQVAKQVVQLREQMDRVQAMADAIQTTRCMTLGNGTDLREQITAFRRRVSDWVQEIREAPTGSPDPATILRWREEALQVLTELGTINLNGTETWLDQLLQNVKQAVQTADSLLRSMKPGKSAVDLERLTAYQEDQIRLLDFQQAQIYRIGNATQSTLRELSAAKRNKDKPRAKAVKKQSILTNNCVALRDISLKSVHMRIVDGQSTMEREVDSNCAHSTAVISAQSNHRCIGSDTRLFVKNMQAAENATMEAEEALKQSTTDPDKTWQSMMSEVSAKGAKIETALEQAGDVFIQRNKTLDEALNQLEKVSNDLVMIDRTATESLSYSKETIEKVKNVKQVLDITEPLAQNVSDKSETQRVRLDDITDRLQQMENRYAQLQGTAQSMVDQANSTQSNLVKLIGEAESSIKQLDSKLLQLRRLADEARSMLDVAYGALAQDPVPMELGRSCVYSLVPYSLTKSRVFDIEFWFKVHDLETAMNSVIMVGRRAFAGRTQMFAFTLEAPEPRLRFSWNVIGGKLEIGPIRKSIWYQVRVTSVLGETRMMLTERPEEDEGPLEPRTQEATTLAGSDHPESALMLDRQMELRIGGVIQSGTRLVNPESWGDNAAETFWSRLLSMSSSEVCVFNLRLGGVQMSIVDLATALPSCLRPRRLRCQILGLTLTPFRGRIGLGNDKLGQDGDLYLDDYVMTSVSRFGDTHFTDLRQRGESLVVENTKPDSQYCLRLTPHDADMQLELDHTKMGSPFNPGVSMTIRFNPLRTITEDISLLRVQLSSAEWFRVWLTSDHRLGILIPGGRKELITREPLSHRPLEDPSFALRDLELAEAQMINVSGPVWKEISGIDETSGAGGVGGGGGPAKKLSEPIRSDSWSASGDIEVVVTLHFGGEDARQLYVLYDQRVVQSWTIPKQMSDAQVRQILVGPHTKLSQPIGINYLVIGRKLVDFSSELTKTENLNGSHIGFCGGQLHPRFFERQGPVGPVWIAQGLDLAPPPGGRRLRFVDPSSPEANITLPGVSGPPAMRPAGRLRREEDCASKPGDTAWFDQTANSYWQLSDLGAHILESEGPSVFKIGFRAQLSRGTSGSLNNMSPLPSLRYTLLAAFNFGPGAENLYLILSESQIFLTDSQRVLWSSPHMTIADTNWHQLVLTAPAETNGNGRGTGLNELNGPVVESGIHMMFDGRDLWLPPLRASFKPILAFVGGLPAGQKLNLDPDTNIAPITGLFGCVDDLEISGVQFDPKQSGRPACYDCFSLDPNIVHIPRSIDAYLDKNFIPLEIPSVFLEPDVSQITFDFSIFYDREEIPTASLFVVAFEGEQNGEPVTHRTWIHLADAEVKMSPAPHDESLMDLGHNAPLLTLPRYANTWQFIKLQMHFDYGTVMLQLQSQVGESLPVVMFNSANRLKSIYFARDSGKSGSVRCIGL